MNASPGPAVSPRPERMRAAVLHGREDVRIEDVPVPAPGPGEVLLRVERALTCGTDAKVFRRGYHAKMLRPPCLFGHEYAGVVEATGPGVAEFRAGDRVAGGNSAPCGACRFCLRGRFSLCEDLLFVNGAFAERMLVPARIVARNLHRIPQDADAAVVAALEPVACVLKGADAAPVPPGSSALLLGAGSIALFFCQVLRERGVATTVLCRSAAAAATAEAMGATHVVVAASADEGRSALLGTTPGSRGFDLVVEAAGSPETTAAAPSFADRGGTVLLFGGCAADVRVTVDPSRLHYEEIALVSSFHHTPAHVRAALDAILAGRIDPRPVLEAAAPLADLPRVLREMSSRVLRGKVPVIPGGAA